MLIETSGAGTVHDERVDVLAEVRMCTGEGRHSNRYVHSLTVFICDINKIWAKWNRKIFLGMPIIWGGSDLPLHNRWWSDFCSAIPPKHSQA